MPSKFRGNGTMLMIEIDCPSPFQALSNNAASSRSFCTIDLAFDHSQSMKELSRSRVIEPPNHFLPASSCSILANPLQWPKIIAATLHPLNMDSRRPFQHLTIVTTPKSFRRASILQSTRGSPSFGCFAVASTNPSLSTGNVCVQVPECQSQTQESGGSDSLAMSGNMGPGIFIDLDELDDRDELWNDEEDLQILRREERKPSNSCRKPCKVAQPKRNLPISAPLIKLGHYQYIGMGLRALKTVELSDGDFLMITDIIHNTSIETSGISLRGHRVQRCRSMNGLLERKLNEVCFFYEVDLDDPRPTHVQSTIEVSLYDVKKLRVLRKTNLEFPLGRSLALEAFCNSMDAATKGGLTARWKYTCTYASTEERWKNNPQERALEFLRETECSKETGVSDYARRYEWRGETIRGGAYRAELENKELMGGEERSERENGRVSGMMESDSDFTIINSPSAFLKARGFGAEKALLTQPGPPIISRKRRVSSSGDIILQDPPRKNSRKARLSTVDGVESTRPDLDGLSMDEHPECLTDSPDVFASGKSCDSATALRQEMELPPSRHTLHPEIDLSSSNLADPPAIGTLPGRPVSVKNPKLRSPGQTLTYGDAFCGGGGASRGAAMAGLRVKWGFDHWTPACTTWQANFPAAKCYELSSYEFVNNIRGSKYSKAFDAKVDILHLSPPCQYFSPAHTVDCPNDDLNVASLFAVGDVVKVAKPRIVTLEQTFGIVAVRFRKYFNSLVQMFTALGFSVRWAVVNLAQWVHPTCLSIHSCQEY